MKKLPADNLSKGIWDELLKMLEKYGIGKECYMVAENHKVEPLMREWFPGVVFSYLGYGDERTGARYHNDLNKIIKFNKQWDSVFSQALLEHVCRPSIAVENMVNACKPGGTIVIHTVKPGFQMHKFPKDCVRFFPDFWLELCKYLPLRVLDYKEHGYHVFVAYRRL